MRDTRVKSKKALVKSAPINETRSAKSMRATHRYDVAGRCNTGAWSYSTKAGAIGRSGTPRFSSIETISAATDRVLTRQAMSSSMPVRAGPFNSGSDLRAIERRETRPHRRRSLEGIEPMTSVPLVRADRPGAPIPNVEGIDPRGPAS